VTLTWWGDGDGTEPPLSVRDAERVVASGMPATGIGGDGVACLYPLAWS
jgi:hypothetical protein